ncbi:MAG: L-seryl-tRNA(Sec) selenium transferase [Pseudomonadota bacterium]|nr:L-seryl-tRNA(Sec) selenium transferase [Pseudomonadota bacterium]
MASARQLPSIDRLLCEPGIQPLVARHGNSLVVDESRQLLAELRERALSGTLAAADLADDALAATIEARCGQRSRPRMQRVCNLTGTVIHTNLGRAVLPEAALQHILATAGGASNLEFDLAWGGRGDRDDIVEAMLCELTGAEAATVVNNNAAAVLLTIAALARGREVVVSRGELVEIGGSFRMPDVMAAAGATMVEVGTTNRTHLADYERAIGERTGLLLKVHTSNYQVQGFTSAVGEAELAPLAQARGVALATDLGSGSLVDLAAYGLPREPMPQEMLRAGCDIVTFSGDKLLGGPQAGLIVGRKEAVERIRRFPMKRALRVSKLPLAALEATLALYRDPDRLAETLPTLRLLTRPLAAIEAQTLRLVQPLAAALAPRFVVETRPMQSQIGSGSLPVERLPSFGLAIAAAATLRRGRGSALGGLARALRVLPLPVLGRVADDCLLLDLRCLDDEPSFVAQLPELRAAIADGSAASVGSP